MQPSNTVHHGFRAVHVLGECRVIVSRGQTSCCTSLSYKRIGENNGKILIVSDSEECVRPTSAEQYVALCLLSGGAVPKMLS